MVKQLDKSTSAAFATGEQHSPDALPKQQKPIGLIINIDDGRARLQVNLCSSMVFGRSDEGTSVDIDLTSFGGREKGVSRVHMTLMQQGNRLFIKDMGSKNGTRINHDALRSNIAYELMDGDVLTLGKLRCAVYFAYEPIQETPLPPRTSNRDTTNDVRADITIADDATYDVRPFAEKVLQQIFIKDSNE